MIQIESLTMLYKNNKGVKDINISLEDVKSKLNKNTKVIYLVHWGGNPIDLDELDKICSSD